MTKSLGAEISAISHDAILEQLGKVLSSLSFQRSERSGALLRFLVEQTISGQTDRLKEYTLGTEALGRGSSFDPRTDTIVRAEVSRLRNRLDKYYATEGLADSIVIALSKGSYVPRFQFRAVPSGSDIRVDEKRPALSKIGNWFALGLGAAACVLAVVLWGSWREPQSGGAVSIAVLPFANVSTEPSQEFFSDGMTDEIAQALANVPALRIVARSSAFAFKNQNKGARAVGQALGATHLIEGSVRQTGNRVRISAQLIEAENGLQLWSETYDRDLTDIFAVQEDIAQSIVASLHVPLGLAQGDALVRDRTKDLESYDQFLRARALVRGAGQKAIADAIALLEHVVTRDPGFAPAWGLLAQAYALVPPTGTELSVGPLDEAGRIVQSSFDKAESAAREAIRLDSRNALGYGALARVQSHRGKWAEAEDLFKQALALDSGEPDVLENYSQQLFAAGRLSEALSIGEKLRALEPFVPIYTTFTATYMQANGQNTASIPMLEAIPPSVATGAMRNSFLAQAYAAEARYAEAADTLLLTTGTLLSRHSVEDAAQLLRTAPAKASTPTTLPTLQYPLNFIYAHVGAHDRLLEPNERALEIGYNVGAGALWHPNFAPLRKTERFKSLVRKAGLVDYWRARGWPDLCRPEGADDFVCD